MRFIKPIIFALSLLLPIVAVSDPLNNAREFGGHLESIDTKLDSVISGLGAAGKQSVGLARIDYSSTSVTTSAYTTVAASLSDSVTQILFSDQSGQVMVIAVGGSGSEVDKFYIPVGGSGVIDLAIPSGSRVSVKAVTGTASSGDLTMTFLK